MTMFEGRSLPDVIDWPAQLGQVLTKPYDVWYGDARPLDWVVRYAKGHPDEAAAIASALGDLLQKADPEICGQILEQVPYFPLDLTPQLLALLASDARRLASQPDPYREGQSLLGSIVRAVDAKNRSGSLALNEDTAVALASISRAEDGFPESLLIAMQARFDEHLPRLVPSLERMSVEQLTTFSRRVADFPSPLCERAFDTIGKSAPTYIRKRIAKAIKQHVGPPNAKDLEAYRALAKANNWPEPVTQDRWPDFARRLSVDE